jgi:hypothetical protein
MAHFRIKEFEMELVIYVVLGCVFISNVMGTWFISRMIIKLDANNKPIFQEVFGTAKQTKEISNKIDHVLVEGQKSTKHQQKMFEHDRLLLASLNSQVAKLDVMIRVATQDSQVNGNTSETAPKINVAVTNQDNQRDLATPVTRNFKLDGKSLPKTEQGIALLEQLFRRRQVSSKSGINETSQTSSTPKAEQSTVDTANKKSPTLIPGILGVEVPRKNEASQESQASHQQINSQSILNLFARERAQSSSEAELERKRA